MVVGEILIVRNLSETSDAAMFARPFGEVPRRLLIEHEERMISLRVIPSAEEGEGSPAAEEVLRRLRDSG
jgi:hypothetical protein